MTAFLDQVQIQSITGDANRGGWEAQLITLQDTDAITKWQQIELFLRIFSQGWDEDYRVAMTGHALPLGLDFDFLRSGASFSIATSNRFLETASVQGIPWADAAVPANDHEINGLRIGHIVKHILEYHCNISSVSNPEGWVDTSDIDTANSTRVNRLNFEATNNMWSALQELARFEFYYLYFSRDNAVHYEPHPMFGALPDPVMDFDGDFCNGRPNIQIHAAKKVSMVTLWATDEDGTVYTSNYPAFPSDEGTPVEIDRIRVGGAAPQARLDDLAEREYKWRNRDYTVNWPAPGLSGLLFELLDRVTVTYDGPTEPAGVHVAWTGKPFWIHRIQVTPGDNFTGQTVFMLEEEPTAL